VIYLRHSVIVAVIAVITVIVAVGLGVAMDAIRESRPCLDRAVDPSCWNDPGSCRQMQTLQQENGSWVCRCPKP
jgi:hypothetical protein